MKFLYSVFFIFCFYFQESVYAINFYTKIDSSLNDSVPYYNGGNKMLSKLIIDNLDFRYIREMRHFTGFVEAKFTVTNEGKIKNLQMVQKNSYNPNIVKQVGKILAEMPDWRPGDSQNGDFDYQLFIQIDSYKSDENAVRVYPWDYYKFLNKIEEDKNKFLIYYNEGVKLSNEGNWEAAKINFDEAIKLRSEDIFSLYNRGIAKYKLNDKNGACEDWNKIKSLKSKEANELINKFCSN